MEQILQRFLVQTLCAKLALCRIAAATYSEALLSPTLPGPERLVYENAILLPWSQGTKVISPPMKTEVFL